MTNRLLTPGTRVMIDASDMDAIPLRSQIHARSGVVLRYATPEIQARQVWTDETYAVVLDDDDATMERMMGRNRLVVLDTGGFDR
jgi:hypothetical protein